jgi:mRNA-degrading endonuclease RelE of RelBE toxin-antitoxin system
VFTFIETKLFTSLVGEHLSDDEYQSLQARLIKQPDEGKVIPGSGGVRKLRFGGAGRGKRGGYRVIYFKQPQENVIWMLTMYSKNVKDDIPSRVLRQIREEIENG